MASSDETRKGSGSSPERGDKESNPDWADGLKQLYDAVVEEPLPDTFKDLLAQFDDGDTASDDLNSCDPSSEDGGSV